MLEDLVASLRLLADELHSGDLVELADKVERWTGYDEETGYCNCPCCDHGL